MKQFITFALAALPLLNVYGQTDGCPGSDNITPGASCSNTAYSVPGTFSNGGLTVSTCASGNDKDDGWFRFTATSSSTTITASASGQSIALALYSGTSCNPANGSELNCTGIASGASGTIVFATTNGATYLIQIHRTSGNNGADVSGNICVFNTPTAVNGTCATAATLSCASGTISGTTVGATNTSSAGTGCSLGNVGAWYTFVGDGQQTTITSTAGAGFDHEMAIMRGSCGSFTSVSCNDNGLSGGSESYTFNTTNGTTYYVYISNYSSGSTTTGTFTIARTCTAAPVSGCLSATNLPCGTSNLAGTTVGSTNFPQNTGCTSSNFGTWYTFTGDGQQTTISTTAGAGFDHKLVVSSGNCTTMTNIACIDNSGSAGTETYSFTTVNGTTYYVYIAYYGSSGTAANTGTFTVSRTCNAVPVSGCSGASSLACGTSNLAGTTVGTSPAPSGAGCSTSNYGSWYTFTGDGQQTTINTTAGAGFDHEISIASGSCASLTNITCVDNSLSAGTETYTFNTTNGTTYFVYIAYYGASGTAANTGTFTISRNCSAPPVSGCSSAASLACGTTNLAGTTVGASPAPSGTGCTTSNYGAWYTFVGDGQQATINTTAGAGFDHEISIATGNCASLSNLNCVDNSGSAGTENVVFTTVNGTTYYVYIAYYGSTGTAANTGTFTITKTCGSPPTATSQDCDGSIQICNDQSFAGNSSGDGNIDLNATNEGCASENQSSWYFFSPMTTGTMSFQINTAVDYDFAIWGPFNSKQCPLTSAPVRCSFAAEYGNTGLNSSANDVSEDASGDRWVSPLNINASGVNKYYIMLIDNFWSTSTPFTIDFSLTGGLTLDCTALPVDLVHFLGYNKENKNYLNWLTLSERQSDYFLVEKSTDGLNWMLLEKVKGQGNSNQQTSYTVTDSEFALAENYYRLLQVDFDGTQHTLNSTIIDNRSAENKKLIYVTNSLGQKVDNNFKGLIFEMYSDGSIVKKIQ